jgi:hypothetical protein
VVVSVATFAFVASGCGSLNSLDPTEGTFYVKLLNDTSRTVVASDCTQDDGTCSGRKYHPGLMKPGQILTDLETYVDGLNVELITSTSGRRLGCVPVYFAYKANGTLLRVSSMVKCRKTYPMRRAPSS